MDLPVRHRTCESFVVSILLSTLLGSCTLQTMALKLFSYLGGGGCRLFIHLLIYFQCFRGREHFPLLEMEGIRGVVSRNCFKQSVVSIEYLAVLVCSNSPEWFCCPNEAQQLSFS